MHKAIWHETVIAESDKIQVVDGYTYFPPESVHAQFLKPASVTTVCAWKGMASYFDIVVGEKVNAGAAWSYREPTPKASHIGRWIGFWRDVKIQH